MMAAFGPVELIVVKDNPRNKSCFLFNCKIQHIYEEGSKLSP